MDSSFDDDSWGEILVYGIILLDAITVGTLYGGIYGGKYECKDWELVNGSDGDCGDGWFNVNGKIDLGELCNGICEVTCDKSGDWESVGISDDDVLFVCGNCGNCVDFKWEKLLWLYGDDWCDIWVIIYGGVFGTGIIGAICGDCWVDWLIVFGRIVGVKVVGRLCVGGGLWDDICDGVCDIRGNCGDWEFVGKSDDDVCVECSNCSNCGEFEWEG